MRIAFLYDAIYPWVNGGAERRNHELARRLATRHEVHLVGWQWWEGPPTIERDGMLLHGVGAPPRLYGADGKRTVREALAFSARVVPVLLRNRWDVVDCSATPYLPVYPARLATRLTGTPLVVTWHEFWGDHWGDYLPERPLVARLARWLESGARRLGDRVVSVSAFTAGAMGMADSPRVSVVPNGVDVAAISATAPAADASELLYLGRLIDEKRVELLLDALVAAADAAPDLRCDIVGDGPHRGALERLAGELGLGDRVRFLGNLPQDEVLGRLRSARMLVQPSGREGYAMAVAEAQAAGVVPIVADGPFTAAPDLVRDGIDGLVVEPTAAAMAEAITGLRADPGRLRRLADAARNGGAMRDWGLRATELEQVYTDALGAGRRARVARRLEWQ
jgi:glycosyltransferase involved in cell wall biosynthesis